MIRWDQEIATSAASSPPQPGESGVMMTLPALNVPVSGGIAICPGSLRSGFFRRDVVGDAKVSLLRCSALRILGEPTRHWKQRTARSIPLYSSGTSFLFAPAPAEC